MISEKRACLSAALLQHVALILRLVRGDYSERLFKGETLLSQTCAKNKGEKEPTTDV